MSRKTPQAVLAVLLTAASVVRAADIAKARASLPAALSNFFGAIPPGFRANALHFVAAEKMDVEGLRRVGNPAGIVPAAELEAQFNELASKDVPVAAVEMRMGMVADELLAALPPEEFAQVKSAYNDAQRRLFDAGAIDRFVHTTTERLGMVREDGGVDVGLEDYHDARYSIMRLHGREIHVLSGQHRHSELTAIFDAHIKPGFIRNAEQSVFMLEGSGGDTPEVIAAENVAHEFSIPDVDPIVNHFQRAVIDRLKLRRPALALREYYSNLLFGFTYANDPNMAPEEAATFVRSVSIQSELPGKILEEDLKAHLRKMRRDPGYLEEFIDVINAISNEVGPISNALSHQVFQWLMEQYPDKRKVFVYFRAMHLPILEWGNIHALDQLSPAELRSIVDRRIRTERMIVLSNARIPIVELLKETVTPSRLAQLAHNAEVQESDFYSAFEFKIQQAVATVKFGIARKAPFHEIAAEIRTALSFSGKPKVIDAAYVDQEHVMRILRDQAGLLVQIIASKYRPIR